MTFIIFGRLSVNGLECKVLESENQHSRKMSKRGPSPPLGGTLIKRAKADAPPSNQIAISSSNNERNKGLIRTVQRTSSLEAPIVSLAGAHSVRLKSKFTLAQAFYD